MEATDRAIELSSTVDALLNTIQSLSKSFSGTTTYQGGWKIGLTDYAEADVCSSVGTISLNSPLLILKLRCST